MEWLDFWQPPANAMISAAAAASQRVAVVFGPFAIILVSGGSSTIPARLQGEKVGIPALGSHQRFVRAALDDLSAIQDENLVCHADSGEAVRNHDCDAVSRKFAEVF